ncbi:MAG: [Oscillospiraceae bacterium]|nr:[FeFe] hydrogenase H-cluster radical SAM maturase HydE [Oscillospiraceae bacterium]
MKELKNLILKLEKEKILTKEEFAFLIKNRNEEISQFLFERARKIREAHYGKDVYIRGLIEFTNYCKNDCLYCGIRRSNKTCERYRLTKEDILLCCEEGYGLGFRTFVLQGGEDNHYSDDYMCEIISEIKGKYP